MTFALAGKALWSAEEAVIEIAPPGGGYAGAVYTPAEVIDPQPPVCVLLQLSAHVAGMACELAVAVNVCVAPAGTLMKLGDTTIVVPTTTVIWAVAVLVGSACEMAVMVTAAGLGTVGGAV